MSKLNEKLKTLMSNQEWTQKKLADRMFVSPDAVSSWVRGVNHPSLETVKQFCEIFLVPIQELTDDDVDIPEYYVIDQYLPYSCCHLPKELQDSEHIIIEAYLKDEGRLHRFTNCVGAKCSAIYQAGKEVWWHYREHEARMIRAWNEGCNHDR